MGDSRGSLGSRGLSGHGGRATVGSFVPLLVAEGGLVEHRGRVLVPDDDVAGSGADHIVLTSSAPFFYQHGDHGFAHGERPGTRGDVYGALGVARPSTVGGGEGGEGWGGEEVGGGGGGDSPPAPGAPGSLLYGNYDESEAHGDFAAAREAFLSEVALAEEEH